MKLKQIAIVALLATALAACNSTDATLGVEGAGTPEPQAGATQLPAATTAPATATPAPTQAVALSTVRARFAPIIGAPVEKVTPLSRRLSARAKEKSITIVASTDETATHVLKGYFSVLSEGSSSTVIYVFDILDPSGNRLHRIQGQESVAGNNATDGWAAVPATVMETIADKAMAGFAQWLSAPNA
jgi:predicted small secreted protein